MIFIRCWNKGHKVLSWKDRQIFSLFSVLPSSFPFINPRKLILSWLTSTPLAASCITSSNVSIRALISSTVDGLKNGEDELSSARAMIMESSHLLSLVGFSAFVNVLLTELHRLPISQNPDSWPLLAFHQPMLPIWPAVYQLRHRMYKDWLMNPDPS